MKNKDRGMKTTVILSGLILLSSAYAGDLGTMNVQTPLGLKSIVYEVEGDYVVVEGDILLVNLSQESAVVIPKLGGSRWQQGIVAFEMDEELPISNKLAVLSAIVNWQEKSNIRFVELTSKNKANYSDYIRFIPATGTTCSSHVGKQGGTQVINLAPRCNTGNTVHEIGHALGLWHEQSRADRNQYIRIVWDNISADKQYNFNQHITDGQDYGQYDYQSIMHYGPYAFSKNGEQTIFPLNEGKIGQRDNLSEKDIAAINAMYPEI